MARELAKGERLELRRIAELRKPGFARALAAIGGRYTIVHASQGDSERGYRDAPTRDAATLSSTSVLSEAGAAGLRFVGVSAFPGLFTRIPRENWVTDDGVVRLSARRHDARFLEGAMSSYYLSTTFDDGSVILTWSAAPPFPSAPRVESRRGTGNLASDLSAHRVAVERHRALSAGAEPIVVESIHDCIALTRYFDVNLTTNDQVQSIAALVVMRWGMRLLLVGVVIAIVRALLGAAGG